MKAATIAAMALAVTLATISERDRAACDSDARRLCSIFGTLDDCARVLKQNRRHLSKACQAALRRNRI